MITMKQVKFDIELVKKIQAGEIKGIIRTRDGRKARFLGEIHNSRYPLIFACSDKINNTEYAYEFAINGSSESDKKQGFYDIIIEIEMDEEKCSFKPFDKVLCRDSNDDIWKANLFSHEAPKYTYQYYVCGGGFYKQCIPYEGNESLVGTTDKPQED